MAFIIFHCFMKKTFIFGLIIGALFIAPAVPQAFAQTNADAQILAIMEQIKVLQARILELAKAPAGTQNLSGEFCYSFTRPIRRGEVGKEVEMISKALVKEGFLSAPQSVYNTTLAGAVTKFQEIYKNDTLVPFGLTKGTGYAGKYTIAKLNALYTCVNKPVAVASAVNASSAGGNSTTSGGSNSSASNGNNSSSADTSNPQAVAEVSETPSRPVSFVAEAIGSHRVRLSWNARVTGNDTDTFTIERKVGSGVFQEVGTAPVGATSFIDTNLTPDTTYVYQAFAFRAGVKSLPSSVENNSAKTWKLGDTNNDGTLSIADFLDLAQSFGKSAEADGYNPNTDLDNNGVIDQRDYFSFQLYSQSVPVKSGDVNGDGNLSIADFLDMAAAFNKKTGEAGFISAADINSDGVIDTRDTKSFEMLQKIQQYNETHGQGSPAIQNTVASSGSLETQGQRPENFVAVAQGANSIKLTWTMCDVACANDTFTIERKNNAGEFVQIASLPAGTRSYTDLHLTPETTYTYQAFAFRDGIQSSPSSMQNNSAKTWKLGDTNNDGTLSIADFLDMAQSFGKSAGSPGFDANADLDDNGVVNTLDYYDYKLYSVGTPVKSGDVNGDGNLSIADFLDMATSFNKSAGNAGFIAGADINNDGKITKIDTDMFQILMNIQNYNPAQAPASASELEALENE